MKKIAKALGYGALFVVCAALGTIAPVAAAVIGVILLALNAWGKWYLRQEAAR